MYVFSLLIILYTLTLVWSKHNLFPCYNDTIIWRYKAYMLDLVKGRGLVVT